MWYVSPLIISPCFARPRPQGLWRLFAWACSLRDTFEAFRPRTSRTDAADGAEVYKFRRRRGRGEIPKQWWFEWDIMGHQLNMKQTLFMYYQMLSPPTQYETYDKPDLRWFHTYSAVSSGLFWIGASFPNTFSMAPYSVSIVYV